MDEVVERAKEELVTRLQGGNSTTDFFGRSLTLKNGPSFVPSERVIHIYKTAQIATGRAVRSVTRFFFTLLEGSTIVTLHGQSAWVAGNWQNWHSRTWLSSNKI